MIRSARHVFAAVVLAIAALVLSAAPALADYGVANLDGAVSNQDGSPATQASSHPFEATTTFDLNTSFDPFGQILPEGFVKDLQFELPAGFIGDPTAVPRCTHEQLGTGLEPICPPNTQVGIINIRVANSESGSPTAVYNMLPPAGMPAQFAFTISGSQVTYMNAEVRSGSDFGLRVTAANVSHLIPVTGSSLTFWGTPADSIHDIQRCRDIGYSPEICREPGSERAGPHSAGIPPKPFLRNPTSCSGPQTTTLRTDSWQEPGAFKAASFVTHDNSIPPNPIGADGCDKVPFEPTITVRPTTTAADSPAGLEVDVHLPQNENPDGLAEADLKTAVVTLPAGMSVNPSSAAGLGSCSAAEIGLSSADAATCPNDSKIGSVEIESPLLDHAIVGGVYLGRQQANPFGSLLAIYIAVADPQTGVVIKLPGKIVTDERSGQVTATFDDNPQLPLEDLRLEFFGGPRAALVSPPSCGAYTTEASFTPWSGTAPVTSTSTFQITSGPNGKPCPEAGFAPTLAAGTTNPVAGKYSPFVFMLSREDGTQRLESLNVTLPRGLLGKLAGIPYCADSALAAVSTAEGTGTAQLASPSCPAASQVGTVSVGAGAGPSPFHVNTGKAYLAGPYKGAPLSLAIVTPALAGPFDLGNVVVRTALRVDPETTQLTVTSDPIPTILHGIPLDLRTVSVSIDRDDFTINPTSCDPMAFSGTASSPSGATAALSDRFQVGSCASLGFKPKLAISLSGAPTHRGGHPKLRAVLSNPAGAANISRAAVTLPKTEFLENAHIETVCTRVQYRADQCPAKSIYGYAKAWSPLLDQPLQGPVYLRSSDHELPDLVASLDGQIHIDLAGRIDSVHSRIRNTFEFVPDAPVSRFVLTMKGGSKGLLVNNTELCKVAPRFEAKFDGQNGKVHDVNPVAKVDCGKKGK